MISGVVIVDKPRGPTSFDMVAEVRRAAQSRRVGHTGTLDPMASGVLPICIGEATKLVPFLMGADKVYEAEVVLGVATDTLDATGRVTERRSAAGVDRAQVSEALSHFVGRVKQRPPAHSAVHVDGRRAYQLARAGEVVVLEEREVRIDEIRLDGFSTAGNEAVVGLLVRCGKGTYIRSLAADLGERLGCGAHLSALRRTRTAGFGVEQAVPPERLREGSLPLIALSDALAFLPFMTLEPDQVAPIRDGKLSTISSLTPPAGADCLRLLRPDGTLLAVARVTEGALRLERVFC